MATLQETKRPPLSKFNPVMIVSAYGFVIAIASLLFFYIGFRIDQYFGTAPNFMFGMFSGPLPDYRQALSGSMAETKRGLMILSRHF